MGCNRFGVELPIPIVKKRIALFGNTQDVEKMLLTSTLKTQHVNVEDAGEQTFFNQTPYSLNQKLPLLPAIENRV